MVELACGFVSAISRGEKTPRLPARLGAVGGVTAPLSPNDAHSVSSCSQEVIKAAVRASRLGEAAREAPGRQREEGVPSLHHSSPGAPALGWPGSPSMVSDFPSEKKVAPFSQGAVTQLSLIRSYGRSPADHMSLHL